MSRLDAYISRYGDLHVYAHNDDDNDNTIDYITPLRMHVG